ncbi:MAG: molybdenum cofactor guanylyltransferase [Actinomycetota bacterium]|nr:molybdenum cofactor guanylyltransferase [Actinomycetota bacterium]
MDVAGILLTGGASARMGRTKATLPIGVTTLAVRTAQLLDAVAEPVVEIGPGHSGWPAVTDTVAGGGPLVAMATGAAFLAGHGWSGPAIVVATDLPRLNVALLTWLIAHPAEGSVVPLDGHSRPQPLCGRYQPADLSTAEMLVARGRRAMRDLLDACPSITYLAAAEWMAAAGDPDALVDVDTPADLVAAGLAQPGRQ